MGQRIVCWYSHGAASLIAAALKIAENNASDEPKELVVACIHIEDEYHEPERMEIVEAYLGQPVLMLRDEKYNASVDEVIMRERYMSGPRGARCTKELKKRVRLDWQRDDDIHVFGMDINEESRVDQLIDNEPELEISAPLIDHGLSKQDCFTMMLLDGIPLPIMYILGYHNNNCIGCLKAAGAGYWNKIRVDFPEVFEKRSRQEQLCNVALVKMSAAKTRRLYPCTFDKMDAEGYTPKIDDRGSMRIPLRFLHPDAGSHKDLDIGSCGFFCERNE